MFNYLLYERLIRAFLHRNNRRISRFSYELRVTSPEQSVRLARSL